MGKLVRKVVWTVAGTAASRTVRRVARGAMHTEFGTPRLPRRVRRGRGMATGLAWLMAGAAAMALADVLMEQGERAARLR